MKALRAASMIGLAALAGSAMGQSVINHSYEVGPNTGTGWTRIHTGQTTLSGWLVDRGNIDHVGTQWQAAEGNKSIDLNGNRHGRIMQVLETTPGMEYVVNFSLSGNWGGVANKRLRVTAGAFTELYSVNTAGFSGQNMNWRDETFSFVATREQTAIRFASQTYGSFGVALDNINVSMVPAPASAMALVGLAALRRRRR
jgi:choice-of-anchor C domain-containing protein